MPAFNELEYLSLNPDVASAVRTGAFKSGYDHYQEYGKAEGRAVSRTDRTSLTARQKAIFHLIDREGQGLEIGPSLNPIAPKKNGYKVHTLDHASAEELRAKYQGEDYDLDNIEDVDFIWQGQPLTELIGKTHHYDWIIASHVVEHIPDLITFLQQCEQLLKPNCVLSLAVPDKRYCFDYFQPLSTTGMLLDAYTEKRTRPSSGQIFDHFANASNLNGKIVWSANEGVADTLCHAFSEAKAIWQSATTTSKYTDAHCWHFTPESFGLIISDLNQLGLVRLEVKAQFPTSGHEFFVTLGSSENVVNEVSSARIDILHKMQLP